MERRRDFLKVRNSKRITLNQRLSCTAFELSVAQILELFWLLDEFVYPAELEVFIAENKRLLLEKAAAYFQFSSKASFESLAVAEVEKLTELFFSINAAFFNPDQEPVNDFGIEPPPQTGKTLYKILAHNVNLVIMKGHSNALDYPLSFFNQVLKNLEELYGEQ